MTNRTSRRSGFTLLEIILAVAIIAIMLGIVLPSIAGVLSQRRLQETLDAFDAVVFQVQQSSVSTHQARVLAWDGKRSVRICTEAAADDPKRRQQAPEVTLPDGNWTVELTSPAVEKPGPAWEFWPTGNCEPANVSYEGPAGSWQVSYDPLTARPSILRFQPR